MSFILDERLNNDCIHIGDLKLSRVLLMNDSQYPWIILVPRIADVSEIYELTTEDQHILWDEIAEVSKLVKSDFKADKINIGALGNIVNQLHIHVIARFKDDVAWPGPVWGAHPAKTYQVSESEDLIKVLSSKLSLV